MRILLLGNGAREHALAHALTQTTPRNSALYQNAPLRSDTGTDSVKLFIAPGNPGMSLLGELITEFNGEAIAPDNPEQMKALADSITPDLVVIGPEIPLVAGVADTLRDAGYSVFGPSKAAAHIEGSKAFAKGIMAQAGVATARAESLLPDASEQEIEAVLDHFGPTWVVKDDGLAAGKGVVVTSERQEAREHINAVLDAGNPVLLESFLDGPEISLFCLVDGDTVVPLIPAQDHKRVGEGDTGPNTGGMGAYAPLPWLPEEGVRTIVDDVVVPVAQQMKAQGVPFNGLLYAGLAWGQNGPSVVEFNCRFGDPETQAVLDLLESPLVDALYATATGQLDAAEPLEWFPGFATTVVLAAENYPGTPVTGSVIEGLTADSPLEGIRTAGVARNDMGQLVSAGGRVLSSVGRGKTLDQAREQAYARLDALHLAGGHFRKDIGLKANNGEISLP